MDYSPIYQDPDVEYPCSTDIRSCGFTLFMRLCYNEVKQVPLEEIKQYLKIHLEEINVQNEKGWTALMLVSRNSIQGSSNELVKLLLKRGANPNLQDNNGYTALMHAVKYSHTTSNIETVKLLLKGSDTNLDLQDNDGWTAVMHAVYACNSTSNIETVKFLLDKGANHTLRNKEGQTALKIAHRENKDNSHKQAIKLLRKNVMNQLELENKRLEAENDFIEKSLELLPGGALSQEIKENFMQKLNNFNQKQ